MTLAKEIVPVKCSLREQNQPLPACQGRYGPAIYTNNGSTSPPILMFFFPFLFTFWPSAPNWSGNPDRRQQSLGLVVIVGGLLPITCPQFPSDSPGGRQWPRPYFRKLRPWRPMLQFSVLSTRVHRHGGRSAASTCDSSMAMANDPCTGLTVHVNSGWYFADIGAKYSSPREQ